jgi:hypothetical protein
MLVARRRLDLDVHDPGLFEFDRTVSEMKRDGSFDRILARIHGEGEAVK